MWYNPLIIWLLRSPFHAVVSKGIALITYTGRKSGRSITIPANYLRDGDTLWTISWRDRTWWKNLRGGAKVWVLLAGSTVQGRGQVLEEKKDLAQNLCDYYRKVPQYAKYVGIGLDTARQPITSDCERAAEKMVLVKIDLYSTGQ